MPGPRASEEERKAQILAAALSVAKRQRLEGLSTRQVAAEAGLSHGLVFFHFKNRDALLIELLDWLLEEAAQPQVDDELRRIDSPVERLLELLRREIERVRADRERFELFFDYWVAGTRHPEIRRRIREALENYRAAFRPMAKEMITESPERYGNLSPEGIAEMAVSIMHGLAVQVVIDLERFSMERFMETARGMVEQMGHG